MMKVLTVTLNTAYDLIGRLTRLALGEVNKVESLGLYPAGKGVNVAKVLHDLGIHSAVTGFLGKQNQSEYQHMFANLALTDYFQRVPGLTRVNVKITETEAEVTDLNFQGYVITTEDWQHFVEFSLQIAPEFDLIAVCGSLPDGISPHAFAKWLTQLNQHHIKLILDTSNQALTMGIQSKPWLVKPNYRELETWIGHSLPTQADVIHAGRQLQSTGIENVVVSLGEKGAIWLTQDNIIHAQPPICDNLISTVGAGDSMVAGLIYGIVNQQSISETLTFASAIAALRISQKHVGVTDMTLLKPILEKVKITFI
ncbi:1-phosphofructokinase [Pasteurella canis]|nr:1-phosphofructokinase [Pasteurella canis]UAX43279.1 1-phosphofructokinase [Pasteurella canis]UAY78732.1 1-phosphofructokinase [Pasteurella canis]UDW84842.1 1-phosphofructokinase [Pasteurella canis]UEC24314.1 1-phosphofructokinase [Pasteurella canis]